MNSLLRTTVSSKGQIVLPANLRKMDGVKPGQEFDVERLDCGDYRLVRRATRPNDGAIDWLLACPHKDFFMPINSESTNVL
jgi:AbrB family looped-hinge helix DNA binding protein